MDRKPSGLIQGSKISDYAANLLIADIGAVPQDAALVAFDDDLIMLARTKRQINSIALSLTDALLKHRTGSLAVHRCIGDFRRSCPEILGYVIGAPGGNTQVDIPIYKGLQYDSEIMGAIKNDSRNRDTDFPQTKAWLDKRLPQFPHWKGSDAYRDEKLAFARANIEMENFRRSAMAGFLPENMLDAGAAP